MSARRLAPSKRNAVPFETGVSEPGPLIVQFDGGGPAVLRLVLLENKGWEEWTEETHEPGVWHLHWRSTRFKPSHYRLALPFQRLNHLPGSSVITKKDTLHKSLQKFRSIHGSVFDFYPEGYILPTEYTKFVKVYAKTSALPDDEKPIWICKPTDLSRGRKIFLMRDLGDLRFDQPTLIQRYIDDPLTVGDYKLDLRLYVLVTSCHPMRAFLYKEGMIRFGTEKYAADIDLSNLYSHLTNASINKYSDTYHDDKDVIGGGSKWTYTRLVQHCRDRYGIDIHAVWPHIITLINCTLMLLPPAVPVNPSCFELLGFDVMLDKALKPWIVEVNCSPALGMDCKCDRDIKIPLVNDMIDVLQFVATEDIAQQQAQLDARSVSPTRDGERRRKRGGARPPPPAASRHSRPSHPRASPFRPAGARGVRGTASATTTRSRAAPKPGVRRAGSGRVGAGRASAAASSAKASRGAPSKSGPASRPKGPSGARTRGLPSTRGPAGGSPDTESAAASGAVESESTAGETKPDPSSATTTPEHEVKLADVAGTTTPSDHDEGPQKPARAGHETCMRGPYGGLVPGAIGNYQQIFPFNDRTEILATTLTNSVINGDAPLVMQECLRDIIGEIRAADKAAAKANRRRNAAAAKAQKRASDKGSDPPAASTAGRIAAVAGAGSGAGGGAGAGSASRTSGDRAGS